MENPQHELGYVTAKLEEVCQDVKELKAKTDKIEAQLNLGAFAWKVIKTVILTLAFILAFKFGDISSLWKALVK